MRLACLGNPHPRRRRKKDDEHGIAWLGCTCGSCFRVWLLGQCVINVHINSPADGEQFNLGDTVDLEVRFNGASICTGGVDCRSYWAWAISIDNTEVCRGEMTDGSGSTPPAWCTADEIGACSFAWEIPASALGTAGEHTIEVWADNEDDICTIEGSSDVTVELF